MNKCTKFYPLTCIISGDLVKIIHNDYLNALCIADSQITNGTYMYIIMHVHVHMYVLLTCHFCLFQIYGMAAMNIQENTGDNVPPATLRLLVCKMMEEVKGREGERKGKEGERKGEEGGREGE